MSRFWWCNYQKVKEIHWKKWRSLGLAKAEGEGGFGFQRNTLSTLSFLRHLLETHPFLYGKAFGQH